MHPKHLAAMAAFTASLAAFNTSQAAVTILGGGLAHSCSLAALGGMADKASLETCTAALENEPLSPREHAGTLINRGVIQLRQRGFDAASRDFNAAVAEQPNMGEAFVNRGAALIAQRRYSEGVQDIDRGLALNPEEPEKAWYNRGLGHEGLDDMKSAYFDYLKAQEINPKWVEPARQLDRFTVTPK
jgi:tetratricopeptide (TPR) repeat protein